MDLHKSIYGAQQLELSSSITQIIMIRIIDIINLIMAIGFYNSIMENHN